MRKTLPLKILSLLLSLAIVVYGLTVAPSKINANNFHPKDSAKIILKICQVDTFEGGTGSRKQFILRLARDFERQNVGVLISVNSLTVDNYNSQKDEYDLVSYGVGLEVDSAVPIDAENFYNSGVIDDKVYALPWALGGYYIFSRQPLNSETTLKDVVVSQNDYTSPFVALSLSGYALENYQIKPPVDAYADFITGQKDYLVGTHRDINRIIARGEDCYITPLDGFSDLIQYVSVTTSDKEKSFYAQKFANYLANEGQTKLTNIGMFSPYKNGIYSDGLLSIGEKINITSTYHAFVSGELVKQINGAFKNSAQIDENKKQIKKLLVYLDKKYRI